MQPMIIFPETAARLQLMGSLVRRFGEGGDVLILCNFQIHQVNYSKLELKN